MFYMDRISLKPPKNLCMYRLFRIKSKHQIRHIFDMNSKDESNKYCCDVDTKNQFWQEKM